MKALHLNMDEKLWDHLKDIQRAFQALTGHHISMTGLVRTAIVDRYNFGKIKVDVEEQDAEQMSEMLKSSVGHIDLDRMLEKAGLES
jgi:nicotinate-nucleotide pyrophosphorylase